jgi:site-specific recombinase
MLGKSFGGGALTSLTALIKHLVEVSSLPYFMAGLLFSTALSVLNDHSVLGLSPVHAAFTGLILWFSSIITGWINNWSIYQEIPQALEANRSWRVVLGPSPLKRWVAIYKKHLAGWAGNISLGFFLGMSPKILSFFGLPLDVRHVTLSTGTVTFAASSLGWSVVYRIEFWLALLGLVAIGFMNVGVGFFMAMLVALKSRRIDSSLRDEVYTGVFRRFKQDPLSFFLPPRLSPKNDESVK